jgi:hypothetical protein
MNETETETTTRKTGIVFDPKDRGSYTMRPSKRQGPVAGFVTEHEARRLAKTDRYGK